MNEVAKAGFRLKVRIIQGGDENTTTIVRLCIYSALHTLYTKIQSVGYIHYLGDIRIIKNLPRYKRYINEIVHENQTTMKLKFSLTSCLSFFL